MAAGDEACALETMATDVNGSSPSLPVRVCTHLCVGLRQPLGNLRQHLGLLCEASMPTAHALHAGKLGHHIACRPHIAARRAAWAHAHRGMQYIPERQSTATASSEPRSGPRTLLACHLHTLAGPLR